MQSDEPIGKLGLKLKAAIIQEPMMANTVNIEAELFHYSQTGKPKDIVIVKNAYSPVTKILATK